jgi:serine/threonine protein kinase
VSGQSSSAESNDPRVAAALRDYLERVDRGEAVDREAFLLQHGEVADELRSLLGAENLIRRLAGDAQRAGAGAEETVPPKSRPKVLGGSGAGALAGQFGRYRIVRALGSGAMGTVYLAEDTQLGRQVALKTPHFQDDPSGELLKRFYREAQAAATLRHPNICPVHDVGKIDQTHYLSMAYIEGNPLSAFVRSSKPQPERQVLALVRKLALALQEAHDHKIVHRDLKPDNVMVDKRGEPLIMDFGLAHHVRPEEEIRLTHAGALVGTPAYMSPEQVDGDPEKIGPLSDEYSLGVILYELLTGQLPFRGSIMAVLGQIVTKEAPAPSQARAGLDPRTDALCLKMMAKNPSDRFPSLSAVAEELATILKNPGGSSASMPKSSVGLAPGSESTASDLSATQTLRPQKTLTAGDLASLEELARKCLARHDYEQVIQIAEQVPEAKRGEGLTKLLEKARAATDEIAYLLVEIDEAVRLNDVRTALKKADQLLTIKRGHRRALEIQQQFAGREDAGVVGLEELRSDWKKGGWIPWSVLAFGLVVLLTTAAGLFWWLGRTVIVINADQPGLAISLNGKNALVTVSGKQSIAVTPGKQELTVSSPGLESVTRAFPLDKGHTQRVHVSIEGQKIVVTVERQAPEIVERTSDRPASPRPDAAPKAAAKETRRPPEKQLAATAPVVTPRPAALPKPASAPPAPAPATSPQLSDEKFVPLFNGHDLTGWIRDPRHPRDWRVEKGILVCPGGRSVQSILYSQRDDYKNFHLRMEARLSGTEVAGLYFRVEIPPAGSKDRVPVTGYRIDLRGHASPDETNTGSIWAIGLPGREAYWGAPNPEPIAQTGQWFTLDLIVDGNHTIVLVNGRKTSDGNWTKNHSDHGTGRIALKRIFEERVMQSRKIEIRKVEIAEF